MVQEPLWRKENSREDRSRDAYPSPPGRGLAHAMRQMGDSARKVIEVLTWGSTTESWERRMEASLTTSRRRRVVGRRQFLYSLVYTLTILIWVVGICGLCLVLALQITS